MSDTEGVEIDIKCDIWGRGGLGAREKAENECTVHKKGDNVV